MEIKTNITNPQKNCINLIIESLSSIGYNAQFDGSSRQEATAFINKYLNYSKDVSRLQRGLPPWWSMVANKPPADAELHSYMMVKKMELEERTEIDNLLSRRNFKMYGLTEWDFRY